MDLQNFLGVRITCEANGSVHFTQPNLIDKILKDLRLDNDEVTTSDFPARLSVLLCATLIQRILMVFSIIVQPLECLDIWRQQGAISPMRYTSA